MIATGAFRSAIDLFLEEHGEGPEAEAKFKEWMKAEVARRKGAS